LSLEVREFLVWAATKGMIVCHGHSSISHYLANDKSTSIFIAKPKIWLTLYMSKI